jgi:hypothetical protein
MAVYTVISRPDLVQKALYYCCPSIFLELVPVLIEGRTKEITEEMLALKFDCPYQGVEQYNMDKLRFFVSILSSLGIDVYLKGASALDVAGIQESVLRHDDLDFAVFLYPWQIPSLIRLLSSNPMKYGDFTLSEPFISDKYTSHTVKNSGHGNRFDITLISGITVDKYMNCNDHQTSFCSLTKIFIDIKNSPSCIQVLETRRNLPNCPESLNTAIPFTSMAYLQYLGANPNRLTRAVIHFAKCAIKTGAYEETKPLLTLILSQIQSENWSESMRNLRIKLNKQYHNTVLPFVLSTRPVSQEIAKFFEEHPSTSNP